PSVREVPRMRGCTRRGMTLPSTLLVWAAGGRVDGHRHACAVGIRCVLPEGLAGCEADLDVQGPRWCESIHGPGLQTHPLVVPVGCDRTRGIDHMPSHHVACGGRS